MTDQVLPKDETFEAPDWLTPSSGTRPAPPFHFFYYQWDPSHDLNTGASSYSGNPFRANGELESRPRGHLFKPAVEAAAPFPAMMTDRKGGGHIKQRGLLCREEDSTEAEDQSVKVVFQLAQVGGTPKGAASQSRSGTSPNAPALPDTLPNTGTDTLDSERTYGIGTQGVGGGVVGAEVTPTNDGNYVGWLGNSVAVRVGSGLPEVRSAFDPDWPIHGSDGYSFCAYPVVNGANVDLKIQLWRMDNAATGGDWLLLATQVITNGARYLRVLEPYHLKVHVDNSASAVDFNCYLGRWDDGTVVADEIQCFKDGVVSGSTITAGSGTVNSTTGLVQDATAGRLTTYASRTFGWTMGRDRTFSTTSYNNSTYSRASVVEGVIMVEVTDESSSTVLMRDLFERATQPPNVTGQNVDRRIAGLFFYGIQANGLWVGDGCAQDYGAEDSRIRRNVLWTDSVTDTTAPNDYVSVSTDSSAFVSGETQPTAVARAFLYQRPSTQVFNHHRKLTFVSANDSTTAASNTFVVGVLGRGQSTQVRLSGVVFLAEYVTDGSGAQTALTLSIATVDCPYDADLLTHANTAYVAKKTVHSSGSPPSGYDLLSGTPAMEFLVERQQTTGAPTIAQEYRAKLGSNLIEFDTFFGQAYQDSTSKVVYHPNAPEETQQGRTEGFVFYSNLSRLNSSGSANYTMMRVSGWEELTLTDDGSGDDATTIAVAGEGTGTVNFSTTFNEIDWRFAVEHFLPRYDIAFTSGHRYTSPKYDVPRRVFRCQASYVTRAKMEAIVAFYNARQGVNEAFLVDIPVGDTTSTYKETVTVIFGQDSLNYRAVAEDTYIVELLFRELL